MATGQAKLDHRTQTLVGPRTGKKLDWPRLKHLLARAKARIEGRPFQERSK